MSKRNLKNLTMSFAVATAPQTQETPAVTQVKNIVNKKQGKVATKAPKAKTQRDPNSLLSNNFRKYTVVGTTNFKGTVKLFFANETAVRVKNMCKQGHSDVNYINLPQAMTKTEALDYLKVNPTLLPMELVDEKSERLSSALKNQAHKA